MPKAAKPTLRRSAPIEDYGLIGDCQTAALVSKSGSIDWLCFPRFDSGACFASLLGTEDNGRWQVAPVERFHATRRYLPNTLILETTFRTSTGTVVLTDFMPMRDEAPDVVRMVRCVQGTVRMRSELILRFDYGAIVPWVRRAPGGITATCGPDAVVIRSDVKMRGEDLTTVAEFQLRAGQSRSFVLTWFPSHKKPPKPVKPVQALRDTKRFWTRWSKRCKLQGEHRETVLRSLITLKALTYAPTGGIVAAPTTSLPESLGGVRNWDYRFCWLRDSTFTLLSLLEAGYYEEAAAWREWLLRAVAGSPDQISIMYGIGGERRLQELELTWLRGFADSKPVRIGNAAHQQFQLDVFGEVSDMLYHARKARLVEKDESWPTERSLLEYLERVWQQPDHGIWEIRGRRRHFVHSKIMAWVAFDRAVKSCREFGLKGPVDRWRKLRDRIHREICRRGFHRKLNSFVQSYGSAQLDASVLMMPLVGFLPANDRRMRGTVKAIEKQLLTPEGFVLRYLPRKELDGQPHQEGTFLPCSFWLADNYAMQGEHRRAEQMFRRLLGIRNDLGLLAEEYDPATKRQLGNFPQAFSHIGLINTAGALRGKVARLDHAARGPKLSKKKAALPTAA